MFLNSQKDFIILKADDKQFTLTTKKSLHIIFNSLSFGTTTWHGTNSSKFSAGLHKQQRQTTCQYQMSVSKSH